MASKLHPRANVRLRLEKGTLLLRQSGASALSCVLMDLSEGGCQCRLSPDAMDPETADTWRNILVPGRILQLEVLEPPSLSNFQADAEVRWIRAGKENTIEFGASFKELGFVQKQMLGQTLVTFASNKLRTQKQATDALKTERKGSADPDSLPSTLGTPFGEMRAAVPPPPLPEQPKVPPPGGSQPPGFRSPQPFKPTSTYRAAPPLAAQDSASAKMPFPSPRTTRKFETLPPAQSVTQNVSRPGNLTDAERQSRFSLVLPVNFQFCDRKGGIFGGALSGRTIDFTEGGLQLEGPAPDFCEPDQLMNNGASVNITIQAMPRDISSLCRVCVVRPSDEQPGHWLYGLKFVNMSEDDRRVLREMYIRAGLSSMLRKRTR